MRVDKKTIKTSMTGKCYHLPLKLVNNTFGNNELYTVSELFCSHEKILKL